jgi:hypothetical protein
MKASKRMAEDPQHDKPPVGPRAKMKLPPEIEGGTIFYESLGRWIDNLMGDARQIRKAREELDAIFDVDYEYGDPEPVLPPAPSR